MEKPSPFLMDTNGHCVLCLRKPSTQSVGGGGVTNNHNGHLLEGSKKHFSFQPICQYLKTDLQEVFGDVISSSAELERTELKGTLCEGCAQLGEQFSEHFEELQLIQLKIRLCLQSICGRIEEVEKIDDGGVLEEFKREMKRKPYTSFQLGIVERLRKATLERCTQLFKDVPTLLIPVKIEASSSSSPIIPDQIKVEVTDPDLLVSVSSIPATDLCIEPSSSSSMSAEATTTTSAASASLETTMTRLLFQCLMCPKKFSTYRAKLDHQRVCPSKIKNTVRKSKSSIAATRRKPQKGTSDTFILPDDADPGQDDDKPKKDSSRIVLGVHDKRNISYHSRWFPTTSRGSGQYTVEPSSGKHKCRLCLKELKNRQTFQVHYRSFHLKHRYRCSLCPRTFSQQVGLNIHHQSIHMGVRYKCDICGKLFTQKGALQLHKQSVHFGKQFLCKFCSKPFAARCNMYRHLTNCPNREDEVEAKVNNDDDSTNV